MTYFLALASGNLVTPMTLFFVLGFAAGLLRSDLTIPEQIGKGMALYLMLAIGFKGGAAMASGDGGGSVVAALLLGIAISFTLPLIGFALLRATTALDGVTAAAVAAHYGSVSVVTFVTAVGFLDLMGVAYGTYMVAVVAVMETPAIIVGLALARRLEPKGEPAPGHGAAHGVGGDLVREIFLNGSVVVLVGAFFIGWITGEAGFERIKPFIAAPFAGVLCLFLLDMGLVASRQLSTAKGIGPSVLAFGVYMPLIGGTIGLILAALSGLSRGSGVLLATLAASASYIAVPAAMRIALPRANAAVYLTLSLAITFPFNVLLGIPLYFTVAQWLGLD
jgi:hypothetical protein